MHRTALRVLAVQAVVALAVLVAACSAGHVKAGPIPTFVLTTTSTATTIDYTSVQLAGVPGKPVVHVPLAPGAANLNGTVTGPAGPVAGAHVHIERIVDGYIGSADIASQPDGSWSLPNILGGLYRVRAWLAPSLDMVNPTIMFLAATDTRTVPLQLDQYGGTQITPNIAPNPPIIGEPAELAVRVTTSSVDQQGVVSPSPVTGAPVQLFGTGQWSLQGSATKTTDASGSVSWVLTCSQLGDQPMSVVINSADVFPLNLPPCSPVPTTTTTTSTTVPGATTTSVTRPKRTTTTGA